MTDRIEIHQEIDLVDRRRLLVIASWSTAIAIVAVLLSGWLWRANGGGGGASAGAPATHYLESSLVFSVERGTADREDQRRALDRWRTVDHQAGIAEIPIDVAMDLVVAEKRP